jgi:Flp pilus assembly protein TadD
MAAELDAAGDARVAPPPSEATETQPRATTLFLQIAIQGSRKEASTYTRRWQVGCMFCKRFVLGAVLAGCSVFCTLPYAHSGDLRITLPRRSKLTPVQKLNREGVEAVRKHDYAKAKTLFYKAYLFDPDDPFTLNNLGYVSELEGQLDRALRFYTLASQQANGAVIDLASSRKLEGEPIKQALAGIRDLPLQVNQGNVEAVRLLAHQRPAEAEALLQRTLKLDPTNVFTLNNLGVAKEMEGDLRQAMIYYSDAARSGSEQPAVVTEDNAWRDKPISEIAAESADKAEDRLQGKEDLGDRVARLNLRGVSALNRNDPQDARRYFQQAYQLDPNNAFSLNNLGYVAELDGDTETAQFYYEKARRADRANVRVAFATRRADEGRKLFEVADDNNDKVTSEIAEEREARQKKGGPIRLIRRDGTPVPRSQPPSSQVPRPPAAQPQTAPGLGPPQPPIPQLLPQSPAPGAPRDHQN